MSHSTQHPLDEIVVQDSQNLRGTDSQSGSQAGQEYLDSSPSVEDDVAPSHAVSARPKWNSSKKEVYKTMATFLGFIIMGANDAVYGVRSIPRDLLYIFAEVRNRQLSHT